MNYTQNYQLPQWESSDRILMDDFNEAMEKIEGGLSDLSDRIVIGSYVGDGTSERVIPLPFTPKIVLVSGYAGNPSYFYGIVTVATEAFAHSTIAEASSPSDHIRAVENGFWIKSSEKHNVNGLTENYIAIR